MLTQVRFYVGGMVQVDGWAISRPVSDEEWAGVAEVLRGFTQGWTLYHGTGQWQGASEPTRIYEVLLDGLPVAGATVARVAREMARAAHQQAVLWTMAEVRGGIEA